MLRIRIPAWCGAVAASLALVPCAAAVAQEDAPRLDPSSPAGTEYQLPVDRARSQAGGGSGGSTGSGSGAPLFGAGVGDDDGSGSRATSRGGTGGDGGDTAPNPSVQTDELGTATPEILRTEAPAPDGGGELLAIGGGAAAVLLIGGTAGFAWRRRSTPA